MQKISISVRHETAGLFYSIKRYWGDNFLKIYPLFFTKTTLTQMDFPDFNKHIKNNVITYLYFPKYYLPNLLLSILL